jgi:hypothetical protein
VLRDIAEQFQRWLMEWSEKRDIPEMEAPQGRRDDFVDPYFKGADPDAVVITKITAIIVTSLRLKSLCTIKHSPAGFEERNLPR